MQILLGIITAMLVVYATYYLVLDPRYALWIKYDFLNRKPFTCHKCLNFWAGLFTSLTFWQLIPFLDVRYFATSLGITIAWTLLFIYEEKRNK